MNPLLQCCGRPGAGWLVVDVIQRSYWHLICCPWCPSPSWFWTWLGIGILLLLIWKDAQVVQWEKPVHVSNNDPNIFSGLIRWLSWVRGHSPKDHCHKREICKDSKPDSFYIKFLIYWQFICLKLSSSPETRFEKSWHHNDIKSMDWAGTHSFSGVCAGWAILIGLNIHHLSSSFSSI